MTHPAPTAEPLPLGSQRPGLRAPGALPSPDASEAAPAALPAPRRAPGAGPALASEAGRPSDWETLVPRGFYARHGKRLFNLFLLVVSLPLAVLLCVPIALANWILFGDVRRILYHQPRIGRRAQVFSIYKFRTMREVPAGDFDSWKGGDRLRVTRFGRLLRNTHLDELPQLYNVLRGEMDFVGPRPEMIAIDEWACERIPDFRARNALLPGLTGLAQITHGYAGMDLGDYRRKLAADLRYRERLSLALDVEILARTVVWMLRGRGWRRVGEGARASGGSAAG